MSHDEAVAALEAAVREDAGEQAPAPVESPVAPQGEQQVPAPVAPVAPEAPPAVPAPVAEPEAPTFFNPDDLDPALLPGWRQLQAAFTQKTQEVAEQRRTLEQFGDAETLADAVELYNRISDPSNWSQLAQELSEAMQEAGMSPAEANALAREEVQMQAQQPDPLAGLDLSDPELAPLAQALQAQAARQAALEQRLEAFDMDRQTQAQFEEAEREQQAHALQVQQQLVAIAQANPTYDKDDMEAIVKLAPFFNDDYFQAQAEFEAQVARRLARYYEGKQRSLTPSVQPPGTPGDSTPAPVGDQTVAEVGVEMEEYFRALQASGELD